MKHFALGLLLFLTVTTLPVSADVTFGDSTHAAQAKALVAALPAVLRSVTARVEELSDQECKDGGWDEDVAGCAWKESRRIQMRASCWAPKYFAHELGHQVYWQLLSAGNRSEWSKFWKAHLKQMNRGYARSSASEGFADSFAVTYTPTKIKGDVFIGETTAEVKAEIRSLSEGDQYDAGQDEPDEVQQ